ncbi:hypothetical protein D9619_013355 [Psilocybe cf. subviscida]|uniref:GST N-terminal domain-containing protein n=1 Tax=Psilocybe cf. subviscida TaxID=2480587 RepID=A0A8H5F954_9AGAR|nr:hypothetical protein D9619_013355 [Psilocybe cf. subviscida]
MTIILYDIPSTLKGNAWSPNTWKTRYALNFKGIPYKTEWVEYPDIEALCIKLGIPKSPFEDHYTFPAIHDPSTGAYLSDSWEIAVYLEKTYPDTPKLFPHNTVALQHATFTAYDDNLAALWFTVLPDTNNILNPASEAYFRRTREKAFGKKMEELEAKGEEGVKEWKRYESGLKKIADAYATSSGPFFMGDTPCYADLFVAAYLIWQRLVWGENSKKWKDVASWQGGRWAKLLKDLSKYETIH